MELSVWIDENKKIITAKKTPDAKQVFFKTYDAGVKLIAELVSKGYKLG